MAKLAQIGQSLAQLGKSVPNLGRESLEVQRCACISCREAVRCIIGYTRCKLMKRVWAGFANLPLVSKRSGRSCLLRLLRGGSGATLGPLWELSFAESQGRTLPSSAAQSHTHRGRGARAPRGGAPAAGRGADAGAPRRRGLGAAAALAAAPGRRGASWGRRPCGAVGGKSRCQLRTSGGGDLGERTPQLRGCIPHILGGSDRSTTSL